MNKVTILYNPYKCQCRITIDETTLSNYSSLVMFMNSPFHKWCDVFVQKLESEINGKYDLKFISRKTERDIMEFYIKKSVSCQNYISEDFILSEPLTKRMSRLNKLVLNKLITIKSKYIIKACFQIEEGLNTEKQLISELEIENEYCSVVSKICSEFNKEDDSSLLFCVNKNLSAAKEYLNQHKERQNSWFIILIGNKCEFIGKEKNCFIFQTTESNFMECIFDSFLFIPLLDVFLSYKREITDKQLQETIDYKLIEEVDPVINIKAESKVEAGQGILLVKETYPRELEEPALTFSYEPENIAVCDGKIIKGLTPGDVKISVFKKGGLIPIKTLNINVFHINRIEKIFIDESHIQLPVGGSLKLRDSFLPENAEDYHKLKWLSQNTDIAEVNSSGLVYGKSPGTTLIKRVIGRIEASCRVDVKEVMKDFSLSRENIEINVGESLILTCILYPEECFEENILTYIDHKDVISFYKDKIYGENPGETTIAYFTQDKRIVRKCKVVVSGKMQGTKKKGLFGFLSNRKSN